ncbi:MAG: glycine cleavage system protein GcvH [Candidatus Thermoplasmatota archaeon]|nr:glycine cleavage system protein H [Euryarchaeota archaeon]MEC7042095.1 glycine cleavage system protein GcvH [Candidatus Thermoplasmatota archaeon]MEC7143292.1 glycine cleavage system protein GcvH [Candidatus Thermoplasmatota archaeon]MEC7390935.1 glycine cleavage system protein GcvH [Candidatus Thermoplasmatota archaeon]MEC7462956.1 glycine cleavage system protein GcvH [Candidatus Thermoplasmatota archaeon]|tara:strand:+ start:114 stop:503 length:390 start_codon:yes stop_codon:yes gene_type:complete
MSEIPSELRYTKEHEWIRIDGDIVIVGITDYAQDALTDVVWVEIDQGLEGTEVAEMESFCSVESVKSVSEIYSPISGTILEFNMSLEDAPEQLNQSPYQDGWIAKIKPNNLDDVNNLLDAEAYSNVIGE